MKSKIFNQEQLEYLLNNYKGISNEELTNRINNKFNSNFKIQQVKTFKNNHHLDSGLTGRFEKGQKSWNKGLKWCDYLSEESQKKCLETAYKKGHKAHNCEDIGTEQIKYSHKRRDDEGFVYVKIQDGKRQYNWKQKHRLIWEKANGPIPDGYKVIFKDGNRFNFDLDNLEMVKNSEMLILNKRGLIYEEKEATESGIILAKYIDKINKLRKCKNENSN